MKILFIASGNSENETIAPFIRIQGESLKFQGIEIDYFLVIGKGITGYISQVIRLRRFLKNQKYDLIHAHYSLSGWVAVLAKPRIPIVLSLMGDDAYGTYISHDRILFKSRFLILATFLIQPFVHAIISKSQNIDNHVFKKHNRYIIPNGIQLEEFKPRGSRLTKSDSKINKCKQILYLGDKKNKRKNFDLIEKSIKLLNNPHIEIVSPYPVNYDQIVGYFNSSDVFVLPSFMEGSPNVIKEAMACNCPIVSTDVGDVRWVLGSTLGCYISSFDPEDFANKIRIALAFRENHRQTNGRERIIKLGLDSESVGREIIAVYNKVLAIDE